MVWVLLQILGLYKAAISPFIPSSCMFYPVCSDYSHEAILKYGMWRGSWLTMGRFLRCHPFGPGGVDEVP